MLRKNLIQVLPDSIVFRELAIGENDFADVYIRNTGNSSVRVRCSIDHKSPFRLSNEGTISIAPGLETKISVSYEATDANVYTTDLIVETQASKITIPIKAIPPGINITTDVSMIDIGKISINDEKKFIFSISNIGMKDGEFNIKCNSSNIYINPNSGNLLPNQTQVINCSLKLKEPGDFDIPINILSQSIEKCKPVEVKGTALQNCISLMYEGKEISDFDFQTIYYHQKRIIQAKIVNNGLLKRSFVVFPTQDNPTTNQAGKSNLAKKTEEMVDTTFSAFPSEGLLEPNSSEIISFIFQPEPEKTQMIDDLENLYNQFTFIEIVETGQKIDIQFIGKAVYHQVTLSSVDFTFGKCNANTKTTKKVTITNNSHFLPTHFELEQIAQFRFQPSKGEILPGKSKEVSIIFYPRNLGIFESSAKVLFLDGLFNKIINLIGECGNPDEKPFKRIPIYETDENAKFIVHHPDKRYSYGIEEIKQNTKKRLKFDSYITEQASKRAILTAKSQFLSKTVNEAKSELTRTIGQYTEEELDELVRQKVQEHEFQLQDDEKSLNLTHCDGLKPPEPPIKRKPSPLFILHPEKFGIIKDNNRSQTAFHSRKKMIVENQVLTKKKYKAKPSTPQEINDCARTLTPAQQLMVNASHEKLDLGTVSVFSVNSKPFSISNNLQQYVLVNLQIDCEELSETSPLTQVIPPHTVTNFDIKFTSKKPMNFLYTVHYIVNGHHSNTFSVAAQVVPIEVQLSRSLIEFRFAPDSITPVIKEFVTVTNNSIGAAQFNWTGMNNFFSISQISGTIEIGKILNFEITYSPTTHSHDETILTINVVGGPSRILRCIGDIGIPKLSLSKKIVGFGLIPIGITQTQSIRLKNSGDHDALFTVSHENLSEISVSPENGKVTAHDGLNFQINVKALQEHQINVPVKISIAGAQPIIFTITAKSEFPSVHLQNTEFEFGRHFVGSSAAMPVVLSNDGSIPAILYLDLSPHPEFHIEFPAELAEMDEHSNSITIVSDAVFVTKSDLKQISDTSSANSISEENLENEGSSDQQKKLGLVYKIYVLENTTITFNLVFQPTHPADHSFELPFIMMNVISSSSYHLQPIVSAEAIQAPLWVSDSILNFDVSPIFDPSNPHSRPIVRQIWIRNDHKTSLDWRFDTSDALFQDPAVFSIEPSNGTIECNQSKSIHLSFMPKEAIPYLTHLSIYVKIGDDENVIGQIQLTGVGTKYLYRMSTNHVCLPIVPLNVKSQMDIFVLNDAFIETNLKVNTAIDEKSFPLKINFPNGQKLEHTTDKLPVQISFQSSKSISFSTMVALIDDFGGVTTFEVLCATDNSMFTLYPFFSDKEIFVKSGSGKPILYENKSPYKQLNELTARFLVKSDITELKDQIKNNWNPSFNDMMVQFILRYLNTLVMTSQINSFPADFIQNDFQLLTEMIRNLTNGKKIHSENDRSEGSKDAIGKRRDLVQKIIKYLESYGALLSSVKPEFLLSKADFLQIMRTRLNKQLLGLDYYDSPDISTLDQKVINEFTSSKAYSEALLSKMKIYDEIFNNLSMESWMIIIMQILKIFSLSKITPERFSKTNGVANSIKICQSLSAQNSSVDEMLSEVLRSKKSINASNIFSPSEGVILKWISINYCGMTNDLTKVVTTFDSLKDSLALSSLIKAHTTSIKMSMNENPTDRTSLLNNAIELTTALKELKLGFSPRTNEIIDGSSCLLALTSAYLFETLPYFLPQSTLEFPTTLHKAITKNINVSNTSKAEICYTVTLESGSNYTLLNDSFVVGPNQSIDVPITFNARTIKPVSGRLTLTPSKPRFVDNSNTEETGNDKSTSQAISPESGRKPPPQMPLFSAPIVVDLMSNVSITQLDGTYRIEGLVYEPTKIVIPLKNLLGVPSTLRLISRITQIANEKGTKINQQMSLQEQVIDLLNNPIVNEVKGDEEETPIESYIRKHKMFIFSHNVIEFPSKDSEVELEVEFVPLTIGEFRCLIIFEDDKSGEFMIEVIAKSTHPPPTEVASGKLKAEANKTCSYSIQVDPINTNLMKALSYSIEKSSVVGTNIPERKLKDMLIRRQHEFEGLYRQTFQSQSFTITNSSPNFFEVPTELTICKQSFSSTITSANNTIKTSPNSIHVTFSPIKAGDYPCRLLLLSPHDIRILAFKGIGIAATKEFNITFASVVGKAMKQDIPLQNTSDQAWNYKITLTGDKSFTSPTKLVVKPKTTSPLPVTFLPRRIGTFSGEVTIFNITKEATVIYRLTGEVEECPAEEKIVVNCQARHTTKKTINVKTALIKSGEVQVTTTIPIINFKSDFSVSGSDTMQLFEYEIYAPRSGISAGTITFTDTKTKNYIWYILEIHVDAPSPEETIEVKTDARKSATVKIPIANPREEEAQFTVVFSDDDLFGEKTFIAAPSKTTDYILVVSPLKAMNRLSSVYFYSDNNGEFWYKIHIEATEPPANILAPLTSPLGKFSSTFISLENPLDKVVTFRVDNDNLTAFQVISKRVLQLLPLEKRKIEVRFIPTSLGVKETATVSFCSSEVGDWIYKLNGTGKPPQPLSPIIVSSALHTMSSALVLFTNPFPYPCRFSVSMAKSESDEGEIFRFLIKKKVFTLNSFGEEYQIPFTFQPPSIGQFQTNIVVASLGDVKKCENNDTQIQWVFPIIGNSLVEKTSDVKVIKGRAQESFEADFNFSLVGEKELFESNDYKLNAAFSKGFEFVNYVFDAKAKSVTRIDNKTEITVVFYLSPQRPFQTVVPFTIQNPLGQEWQFQIDLRIDRGKPTATVQIESLLNKSGSATISVPAVFREQTPFHAYFANGSALEFQVMPEHGIIQPSFAMTESWTELPISVVFAPKMYGKVLKGLLVIDTMSAQFIFEVEGKTPEYIPPVIPNGSSLGRLDNMIKQEDLQRMQPKRDKRKIIKENIEFAKKPKITSPQINKK